MSVHVTSWVLRHSEARGSDRLVLLSVADYASEDGLDAYPSVEKIAHQARVSERTARYSLRSLEASGRLVFEGAGPRGTRCYSVRMDAAAEGGQKLPGGQNLPGAKYDRKGGQTSAPEPTTEPSIAEQQAVQHVEPAELAAEIDRLCSLLSDLTRARAETPASSPRYRVTARWRTDMRRLLTIDGRPPGEVEAAIRWVDRDSFWASNVMSPAALRRHYDRLRVQAARGRRGGDRLGIERMRKWAEAA